MRGLVGLAAFCALTLLVGCTQREPELEKVESSASSGGGTVRTLIVVVIDGLRRDALTVYGSESPLVPNLERLAARSRVVADPIAVTTAANSGMASLLTGLDPIHHGVGSLHHRGEHRLADSRVTLAELLQAEGWRTLASLSLPQFDPGLSGLDQGFDTYRVPGFHAGMLREAEACWYAVTDDLRAALESDEPVFALLHFADPLARSAAEGVEIASLLERRLSSYRSQRPDLAGALDLVHRDRDVGLARLAELLGRSRGSAAHRAWRAALYDSQLVAVDHAIGLLEELLEETGREAQTLFVVTSTRGLLLTPPAPTGAPAFPPEVIEVPLLLAGPGLARDPSRAGVTSLLDLTPTLARACGVTLVGDGFELGARSDRSPVRVLSPGFESAAIVSEDLTVEENRIAGRVAWDRSGQRLLPRSFTGAQAEAFERAATRLGPQNRGDELPWLALDFGGGATLRARWNLFGGFLGAGWTREEGGKPEEIRVRGISANASLGPGATRLRCRLGERQAPLRLDLDLGEAGAVSSVRIGKTPLEHSFLPRLRDRGAPSWSEGIPRAALTERGSGWWRLAVGEGVRAGQAVRALVIAYPPDERRAPLAFDCGEEVHVERVPGRDDALWVDGVTPLELLLERAEGVAEFGLAIELDGRQLGGDEVRYGERALAEPGELALYLPDWIGGVTEDLAIEPEEPPLPGELRVLRLGPDLPAEERRAATEEERAFVLHLGAGE